MSNHEAIASEFLQSSVESSLLGIVFKINRRIYENYSHALRLGKI